RRPADNSQLAMRAPYQANRPHAPRLDVQASIDPALGLRGSYRPPAMGPATAKPNSKCPTCSSNPGSDEPPNRHVSASETAQSPRPAPPPPAASPPAASPPASSPPASSLPSSPPTSPSPAEQQPPSSTYKVLPRSYWAGASWRWRLK